ARSPRSPSTASRSAASRSPTSPYDPAGHRPLRERNDPAMIASIADRILGLHGWAAVAVVFLLPALESSAFVGFIFPGEIAVLLGGVLASRHNVALGAVLAAGIAGAIVGDSVGYEVGKRWGRRLLQGGLGRFVKADPPDRA